MKNLAWQVTEERRNYFLNDAEKLIYTNGGKTRSLSHKIIPGGFKKAKSRRQNSNTIRGKGGNQPYAIKTGKTYLNKSQKTTSVKGKG